MKTFITAKQFLEQSEKVQKTLRGWAESNLQKYDLVKPIYEEQIYMLDEVQDTRKDKIDVGIAFYMGGRIVFENINDLIPLFNETQLRHFIEDKIGEKVECIYGGGYTVSVWNNDLGRCIEEFEDLGDDLLQAYWKVAIEFAESEEDKNGQVEQGNQPSTR